MKAHEKEFLDKTKDLKNKFNKIKMILPLFIILKSQTGHI
ncbi:hypothetical protein IMAU30003_01156 [Lactobacillus helveticus]|uniref:Uncharacterized protein n=1 Tax=Lactobacillus helveticus TaxID=1587 RepID=A0A9Q5C5C0_LACHE|nr:hypothetical protein [Lactobacillus helveticus]NRO57321.1 hypothetical protein [Lactobacillus helveticus]